MTAGDDGPEVPIDAGVAGASAEREYERRSTARKERIKSRLGRLGRVVLAVTNEPQEIRAWAQGSDGERELAKALEAVVGIRLLNDRRVPGTRGNIDHLVIGPAGVFVVDAKGHAGTIRIRDVGGLFKSDERLFVGHRDCSQLAENMSWQVTAVEGALRAALDGSAPPPIIPVLCFVRGDWPLFRPPDSFRGVRLESTRTIKKLVTQPKVLDGTGIDRLTPILAAALMSKTQ